MSWLLFIAFAVLIEVITRFLTRGMEDKKKREKLLAFVWVGFGGVLLLIWFFLR